MRYYIILGALRTFYFSLTRNHGKQLFLAEGKLHKLLLLLWVVMTSILYSRHITMAIMGSVEQRRSMLMVNAAPLLALFAGMMLQSFVAAL
jgi:hypothetical protein